MRMAKPARLGSAALVGLIVTVIGPPAVRAAGVTAKASGRSRVLYKCVAMYSMTRQAAPNIFRPSRRVTQSWCQIQLTITTVMHTDSLPRITTRVGNALLSGRSGRRQPGEI